MMTPLFRLTVLATLVLYFTACGSKSGGGSPAPGNPAVKTVDGVLRLKSTGVKKVKINSDVDLRKMLLNYEDASYEVTKGASSVHWVQPTAPILHIDQGGEIEIKVFDAADQVSVTIKMLVVFEESAEIPGELDLEPPQLP